MYIYIKIYIYIYIHTHTRRAGVYIHNTYIMLVSSTWSCPHLLWTWLSEFYGAVKP